jgi:hypothetical protein
MKYGTDYRFWVVTDPTPHSELIDILFEASLRDLELQFKGGLTACNHPTLFTEKGEAEQEARKRLKVAQFVEKIRNTEITEDGRA